MNLHSDTNPLARCIARIADIVGQEVDEADILEAGGKALRDLIARDDWLPEFCSVPDPHEHRGRRKIDEEVEGGDCCSGARSVKRKGFATSILHRRRD